MAITKSEILTMLETYKTDAQTALNTKMSSGSLSTLEDKLAINQAISTIVRVDNCKTWVEANL